MVWLALTNLEDKIISVNMDRAKIVQDVEHEGKKWTIILFSGSTGEHVNIKESRGDIHRKLRLEQERR